MVGGSQTSHSVVLDLNTLQICNNNYEHFHDIDQSYQYGVGGVFEKKYPVICFGFYNNEVVKNCRIFNHPTLTETAIFDDRVDASAVKWDNYRIWITGGVFAYDNQARKNTRIVRANGDIDWSRQLPYEVSGHCVVRLDYKTFVLIGGKNHEQDVYFLDKKNDPFNWKPGPQTIHSYQSGFGCVVFEYQGVPAVMVAGGSDGITDAQKHVEILQRGASHWIEGNFD